MRAVVLCAGLGSRLGELTRETPKPLLDIEGAPLLARILRNLARAAYVDVGINVHHRGAAVAALVGDGAAFGVRARCVSESALTGTAGGAKRAAGLVDTTSLDRSPMALLVHYGDILTDHPIGDLMPSHLSRGAAVTMLVHRSVGSNSIVDVAADGRVVGFIERPIEPSREETWVFSGICILSADVVAKLPDAGDIPQDVFIPMVRSGRAVFAVPLAGFRCAIDSASRLSSARAAVRGGEYRGA